jgi:integrase
MGARKTVISGKPDYHHISTSHTERQNLSMRMGMRRFTRLTNAFSKKLENHEHMIAIYFMHYNFCRIHQTLRVTPWQTVMDQLQSRGKDSSRERYTTVFKSTCFDALRRKKLLETTADDFFAVFKDGKVSIVYFLKRLHNFALSLGWIALPVVAPYLWPKYEAKDRRGITRDEQEAIITHEKKAEWKLFLELLWETGAAQGDAAALTAEHIDWQSRTITYFRQKTGSRAQFTISKTLETVLSHLPATGALFPNLSTFTANDRASRFRRRCHRAGVKGVTLHSYRYAWAERAKVVGMPERFAQAALGHNSKAIHRAYAKAAQIIVPSLEEYEAKAAANMLQKAAAA